MSENMSRTQTWQATYYVQDCSPDLSRTECQVTPMLGFLLRISQCMGISPVRLRRYRDNTFLEISPALVVFQRLTTILSSIIIIIGIGCDFTSNEHVRVGTTIFTALMWIIEILLVISICLIKVITAPDTTDRLMMRLKQINKISRGLNHGSFNIKYPKFGRFKIFSYIFITGVVCITDYILLQLHFENHLVITLYACFYYQHITVGMIRLELAVVMTEITSLATDLNDRMEQLLLSISQNSDGVINSKHGYLTIRQFDEYHEQVCDMVKGVNDFNGPIFLLSFSLLFLHLLITPYNLMSAIALGLNAKFIVQQLCWLFFHLITLLMMVEPCHWMQDQINRSRYLLSRLARRTADGDERFFNELDLFILQFQIKRAVITPMGVFTVSRSFAASVIGGVTTYLAIINQLHNIPEFL